jgi:hypothetical protein
MRGVISNPSFSKELIAQQVRCGRMEREASRLRLTLIRTLRGSSRYISWDWEEIVLMGLCESEFSKMGMMEFFFAVPEIFTPPRGIGLRAEVHHYHGLLIPLRDFSSISVR